MPRVVLLHLAPRHDDPAANRAAILRGVALAGAHGADLVVTPELATSGYGFAAALGIGGIEPQPDAFADEVGTLAARHRLAAVLGTPEADPRTGWLHNAALVIGPDGTVRGCHRKVNALRVGAEAWSVPGDAATVVDLGRIGRVGVLICADACTPALGEGMRNAGATLLVSPAAWAPGLHGPAGEWEETSARTGLPLFVCNRTGRDPALDFSGAESVVAFQGRRILTRACVDPIAILLDWDDDRSCLADRQDLPMV